MFVEEIEKHLTEKLLPFWTKLRDDEYGGYYGLLDANLNLDKKAVKGCILNSRILWFFSNSYMVLKDEKYLDEARHGYEFLKNACYDHEMGGIYWSVSFDGKPLDTMKHTYNQAFAIYALSSYYLASKDKEALDLALKIFNVIETKCKDEVGYMEAFSRDFVEISNDALSENGVMAKKTMNSLLHIMEAYTELYKASKLPDVKEKLVDILNTFTDVIFNEKLERLEVFFDKDYNSIIDLHSYGHDIEASWLMDVAAKELNDPYMDSKIKKVTKILAEKIYARAFDGHSLLNECEKGIDNESRIWWIQAETVVGFINAHEKEAADKKFYDGAVSVWDFIKNHVVDKRDGSEWLWEVTKEGNPLYEHAIVEPWKCPYHNGRMCLEVIKRLKQEE